MPRYCLPVLILILLPLAGVAAEDYREWTTNNGQLVLQDVPDIPADLATRIRRFQNVRSARFVDWMENGRGLYISTRFGAISQLHRVFQPAGSRQQMTWFPDPIGMVARRPGSGQLALTMDERGGERDQVFLFDPRDSSLQRLTDGRSRNRLLRWSRDGRRLAFQSTRRNGSSNDLWIMDPQHPDSAELLLEAEPGSWYGPADFSNDGRQLLVQQFLGVDDSRVLLLNLNSRELQLVAGNPEFPSANRAVSFDRNGTGFYFITNVRGRAAELAWRGLGPEAQIEFLTARISWDVTDFLLSEDGDRGAFITNEDGASALYLFNPRKQSYRRVDKIPLGLISSGGFSPDGRHLALTLDTAQTPSDVYVLELGRRPESAGSLLRWTWSEMGGLDPNSFVEPKLVKYPTFDLSGEAPRMVPAYVYQPRSKGPHPVVIYVHGGPEAQYRPGFSSLAQMWVAELGAAVIAPNIRGSTGYDVEYLALDNGYRREDAIRDIGALLDWIALQPELDASRVAIHGASYGGYVVLASAVWYSDRLRAGVDEVGISNFVSFLENTESYRRAFRRYEYGDERDPEMRAFLEQISPLNNADRIDIPLLVVQGSNDPRVPASESEQIVEALRARGRPVWYIQARNEGHGLDRLENRTIAEQASILFLRRYLLGQGAED